MNVLDILAEDKQLVIYRPSLREIAGSVNAALLLSQILYYAKISNNKFYKFKEPCNSPLYKEGESWREILGFSIKELDGALKKLKDGGFINMCVNMSRVTYYSVNYEKIKTALENYQRGFTKTTKGDLHNSQKGIYENAKTAFTKTPKGNLDNNVNLKTYTETYIKNLSASDFEKSPRTDFENSSLKNDEVKEKPKTKSAKNKTQDFSAIELPAFIDRDLWVDFCAHRKAKRAPLTEIAVKRLLADFEKWHAEGIDCNAAINESVKNGYQGVFKPKEQATSASVGYRRGGEASADVLKRARELSEQMDALGDSGFYSLENQNDDEILLEEIK